jgi:hypothetical protein
VRTIFLFVVLVVFVARFPPAPATLFKIIAIIVVIFIPRSAWAVVVVIISDHMR